VENASFVTDSDSIHFALSGSVLFQDGSSGSTSEWPVRDTAVLTQGGRAVKVAEGVKGRKGDSDRGQRFVSTALHVPKHDSLLLTVLN